MCDIVIGNTTYGVIIITMYGVNTFLITDYHLVSANHLQKQSVAVSELPYLSQTSPASERTKGKTLKELYPPLRTKASKWTSPKPPKTTRMWIYIIAFSQKNYEPRRILMGSLSCATKSLRLAATSANENSHSPVGIKIKK